MPVDRREFLRWSAAGAGAMALPRMGRAAEQQDGRGPNVIVIITDDQGYGDMGCHGNPLIRTPHMDRLHAQSARLTDFHVSPTCSPTRAALMTGRHKLRTGVWHTIMGRSLLARDEVTMADLFRMSGYRTGIFGKWHLGDNYPFRPQDRGFEEVFIHGGGGVGQTPDYWGNDYFDDTYFHNGEWKQQEGYCTDVWFDGALRFIEANRDRPFFAYVTTNAPHSPYQVPDNYREVYADADISDSVARFYGMITNIDDNLGRLRKRLRELDLERDTILVFLTDNGSSSPHFNAGMRAQKGSMYDGGHRVPCFIRWPGHIDGGYDVNRLTRHYDLLPTLADICGLERPDGLAWSGRSLRPLLRGKDDSWPERVSVVDSQRVEKPQKWRRCAVMTDRWRLVNGKELYDINEDPGQQNNIADEHPEVVGELREEYSRWWEDASDRFDEYCRIVLGSENENPARLTCHDWHEPEGRIPWNQGLVRRRTDSNGFWAVHVLQDGQYSIELRRFPREADMAINAEPENGEGINPQEARLAIGGVDQTKPVPEGAKGVSFDVQLAAGDTRLRTWLKGPEGSRGAYYVYVRRLS